MNDILSLINEKSFNPIVKKEGDIKIKISHTDTICFIELSREIKGLESKKELLKDLEFDTISNILIKEDTLYLKSTMWIDCNPTENGLNNVLSVLLAEMDAVSKLLEVK